MAVTRDDLRDVPDNALLWCPFCDGEYSATYGDYFLMADDEEFTCGECDSSLVLVVPYSGYTILKE